MDEQAERRLKKARRAMKENYDRDKPVGAFKIGDWVSVKRHTKDNKMDTLRRGPYQIAEFDSKLSSNVILRFAGFKGTEIKYHQNELLPWPGLSGDLPRDFLINMELKLPTKPTPKQAARLKQVVKFHKLESIKNIRMSHLVGRRIKVKWSQLGGAYKIGTIRGQEANNAFWVEYDANQDLEESFYPEQLLGPRPPQWEFLIPKKTSKT
jgi:hypothetical protein